MIAKSGVKVLDFGLARSGQDEAVSTSRMVMGTPGTLRRSSRKAKTGRCPLQISSFGCVLYEMFTGEESPPEEGAFPSPKLERIVSPVSGRGPGHDGNPLPSWSGKLAGVTPRSRGKRMLAAAAAMLGCSPRPISTCIVSRNSPIRTRSSSDLRQQHRGDPISTGTLRQGLAIQLEQSPFLK